MWQKMGVLDNVFAGKAYEEHKAYEGISFEEGSDTASTKESHACVTKNGHIG